MPVQGEDCAPKGALDVLGHPPVVVFLERTDRDDAVYEDRCDVIENRRKASVSEGSKVPAGRRVECDPRARDKMKHD